MISIIVPIYNKEKSLERCIDSLLNQTYKDIEIILINDGSKDNSLSICTRYLSENKNIRLINKKNGGVSEARNRGLEVAKGDYIQFVDSDDYISEQMCEILIKRIEQDRSDIVICGYKNIASKHIFEKSCSDIIIDELSNISSNFDYLYLNGFLNVPWNKLYKKKLINFKFDENLSLGEDLIFNLNYFKKIYRISLIKDILYNYVNYSADSLTKIYRENRFEIAIRLYNEMICFTDTYLKISSNHNVENFVLIKDLYNAIESIILDKKYLFREKRNKLNEWLNNEIIINACMNTKLNCLKDKFMIFLIKYKCINIIINIFLIKNKIYKVRQILTYDKLKRTI